MKTTLRSSALLVAVAMLAACAAETTDAPAPTEPEGTEAQAPHSGPVDPVSQVAPPADYEVVHGEVDPSGQVDLNPSPDARSRALRRMSVKQLRRAIENATGGLAWRDERGNDMLEELAPTLGVPNYIDTTNEDLEASLVFQKFLGDGVRSICDEAIANDLEYAPADRVMIRYVDPAVTWEGGQEADRQAIDENLRYMKLRITGHNVAPDSEEMSRLRWLFRSVTHATSDPARGWRAVCVGLMSSPEFYLY